MGNSLALEVATKGEVTEHLKESVVTSGITYVIEVILLTTCTYALLSGSGIDIRASVLAKVDVLELVHTGVSEQKGWIVIWNERA